MLIGSAALLLTLARPVPGQTVQDCSQTYGLYRQSVVRLTVRLTMKKPAGSVATVFGTGFVVNSRGHVLTANHIVAGDENTAEVRIVGQLGSIEAPKIPMNPLSLDKSKDIAILAFADDSHPYQPVKIGDPWGVIPGNPVCSLGFPLEQDFFVTNGEISSLTGSDPGVGVNNLWKTAMPSNRGESGAPVFDLKRGGVVVALKYGALEQAQNLNYLIPINLAESMLRDYSNVIIPRNASAVEATPTPAPSEPTLQSVQVRFELPPGDDKDHDTEVAISIVKGNIIITNDDDIAHEVAFIDPKTYGPYALTVQTPAITKSLYRNSTFRMSITPVGHDRWITTIHLEAKFSDGDVVRSTFPNIMVSQDNRSATFVIP